MKMCKQNNCDIKASNKNTLLESPNLDLTKFQDENLKSFFNTKY